MLKSLIVARYTFVELYKSRILFNVFLLGIALFTVTYIASEFSYGTPAKIALDFGMGVTSLSAVAIALFMGVNLISKEIESRTLYMVLSRPISRSSFFVGRILGMGAILGLNIVILIIMTLSLFFIMGGDYNYLITWAYLFLAFESIIVLLVVILFSLVTNSVMSIINTLTIFIVGHALSASFEIDVIKNNFILNKILKVYSYIAPDFSKLNIKDFLLYKKELSFDYLGEVFLYGLTYILFLICLNVLVFQRKNFD